MVVTLTKSRLLPLGGRKKVRGNVSSTLDVVDARAVAAHSYAVGNMAESTGEVGDLRAIGGNIADGGGGGYELDHVHGVR